MELLTYGLALGFIVLLVWVICLTGKNRDVGKEIESIKEWSVRKWEVSSLDQRVDLLNERLFGKDGGLLRGNDGILAQARDRMLAMEQYLGIKFETEPQKRLYRKKEKKN